MSRSYPGAYGSTSEWTRVGQALQIRLLVKNTLHCMSRRNATILHASLIMPWRLCRCVTTFGMLLCLTATNGQEPTDAVPALFSKWLNEQGVDTSAFTVRKKQGGAGYGAFATRTIQQGTAYVAVPMNA